MQCRIVLLPPIEIKSPRFYQSFIVDTIQLKMLRYLQNTIGRRKCFQIAKIFTNSQQPVCIPPLITAFLKMLGGALIENKGSAICTLLPADKTHTRIDTPAENIIIWVQAVGCNIAVCRIGNQRVVFQIPPEVIVGFGEGGAVALADKRFIYGADDMAQGGGVPIQYMLCIETVCRGNRLLRLAYIAATRQQKAAQHYMHYTKRHYASRIPLFHFYSINDHTSSHKLPQKRTLINV